MIHCLIIEDNPDSIKIIESYLKKIKLFATPMVCTTFHDAIQALSKTKFDLIVLDIQLDQNDTLNGMEILKTVSNLPPVIITTNFHEFAIESYTIGKAVDYILKPVDFQRFLIAVNRVLQLDHPSKILKDLENENDLFFKIGRKFQKYSLDEIDYFEAYGIYSKLFINQTSHVINDNISKIEEKLEHKHFMRVHKSFIINLKKISGFDHTNLYIQNTSIPIGSVYKYKLDKLLSMFEN